jgi:hypothetical protein
MGARLCALQGHDLIAMMLGGYLLEAGGCLGQGAEDAQEITVGHSA